MELSSFRQKILRGDHDQTKRESLIREYSYFASIAPKSLFSGGNGIIRTIKEKLSNLSQTGMIVLIVCAFLMLPVLFFLLSIILPTAMLIFLILIFMHFSSMSPEYKAYDFRQMIAEPALKVLDEHLAMIFHFDRKGLTDEEMGFDDALVESHLVRPFRKRSQSRSYSCCSYDWGNVYNTDAFEFMGYKIFIVVEDSDGNKREESFFNGTIFKFRTSFTINGVVNIMSTNTKKNLIGVEKEKNSFKKIKDKEINVIDTENHEFAECFDTIATYDEEAYKFLTPAMIENLLRLRKDYFFSICLKDNIMTVAIDGKSFKDATQSAFGEVKPSFAPKDTVADVNARLNNNRNAILSIYELKDILDPNGIKGMEI